jgi:endoplasmic reticulum Man9GlcNAc2 1,2-alpha-mannosidase
MLQVAGWPAIAEPVKNACTQIMSAPGKREGLLPIFLNRKLIGKLAVDVQPSAMVTLGARGDSYYEYLLKQYIFSGRKDDLWLEAYMAAMNGVRNCLVGWTAPAEKGGLLFVGEQKLQEIGNALGTLRMLGGDPASHLSPKMDHLVCFLPGVLALGHYHGIETGAAGIFLMLV